MQEVWWGTFQVKEGEALIKQIGPLLFAIKRVMSEWQIYYDYLDDSKKLNNKESFNPKLFICEENLRERYIIDDTDETITLEPVLADRPVVTQPVPSLYIPAGQRAKIFVSTPLWVRVVYGKAMIKLNDIAIIRPSDTWFGPNTIEGEFCYASQTNARLDVTKLPTRYHRATTSVHVINNSESLLLLDRINLPVIYLQIYQDGNNQFWTQAVKMIKYQNDETAGMEILPGSPLEASGTELLCEARETPQEKTIIRKISGFFA